ncbi:glycerophosphodiester phosphodiesterase [Streptomyces agglomeratus]|uniref:glycerophosphodiester phosphodiesterase n=1 Tax=Streptomyces agglomeratus TaxID=285458 RepID=UPI000854FCEA|nr:glycerophosphodiester phosphodiesterase family protein [Streptomyces agglomeratus]OEJ51066.1 glycerophosphodiester phosphodiesterase [Streptomyces agglomeratus]OEJ58436.1 glycerophosphodiester phosphodiesterase [Streptomyces agglomeratus]
MSARTAPATATALLSAAALLLPATAAHASAPSGAHASVRLGADDEPAVIAHRGASAYAPENTLVAIDLADRMGFDWVENDVQRTKDGELVVVHDDSLARTTNVEQVFPGRAPWKIKDFTAAEIATLDAGSWFGPEFAGARVPTLKQYVNRVERNRQKLLLEIKKPELYPGIERDTLRVLRKAGWLNRHNVKHRLVIQSFGVDSVKAVHAQRPDLTTGFLGTPAVADLPEYARFTDQINPTHTSITADYVAAVHKLKGAHGKRLQVNTWTVNTAAAATRVDEFGVDGIITNNPDIVRDAVGE